MSPRLKMSSVFLELMLFLFGSTSSSAQLTSFRVENVEALSSVSDVGELALYAEQEIRLRIFSSRRLSSSSQISFTNADGAAGTDCSDARKSDVFDVDSVDDVTAVARVTFTRSDASLPGSLMFCYREQESDAVGRRASWIHQGNSSWMRLSLTEKDDRSLVALLWVRSVLVPVFLLLSAVFSGLSLTLLGLTRLELKVMRNQGGSEEKKYSKAVAPLRKRGNVLFCGLLLLNVLANVVVVVFLYELIGLYSILAGTLLVVVFGELAPQTICTKYGLSFGSKMSWLTDAFLILTLPFSYPVGKIMDLVLDDEVPAVYNRDRIREMVARPGRAQEPARAATGERAEIDDAKPFRLSNRTVGEVMIGLEDAYMEEYDSVLTSEKVTEILKMGYTRVPVYEKERSNVVALLHVRDLALIDPCDRLTLKAVCKFYNRPVNFVFEDTKLTVMLEEFKKGNSHMAFVQRVNDEGPGDPYYETLGMITLEDVIEDIFHSDSSAGGRPAGNVFDPQIHFQSSKITSDLERLKFNQYLALHRKQRGDDRGNDESARVENLPANLLQAVKHFLPTVLAFQPDFISSNVLERLLKQGTIIAVQETNHDSSSSGEAHDGSTAAVVIVEKGRPMDFFVLILEGKVRVTIGADNLEFMEGPFAHFGHPALKNVLVEGGILPVRYRSEADPNPQAQGLEYVPDFSVCPATKARYLKIPLSAYLSSLQATQLQRMSHGVDSTSDVSAYDRRAGDMSYADDEAFVEANNTKNAFLSFSRQPSGCFLGDCRDFYGGAMTPVSPLPLDYPYRLDGSGYNCDRMGTGSGAPSDFEHVGFPAKSPSDEWLDRHVKREVADSCSRSQGLAPDRSTAGEDAPVRALGHAVQEEGSELVGSRC